MTREEIKKIIAKEIKYYKPFSAWSGYYKAPNGNTYGYQACPNENARTAKADIKNGIIRSVLKAVDEGKIVY